MPNFPVSDVPVQVSQTVTQGALIRNVGNATVFLDAGSAVSSASFGVNLSPGDTVNWQPDLELWGVCNSGETSSLAVLYNATGTSLANVTAEIDGTVDVDLLNPVNVQGGGEVLAEDVVLNVLPGSSVNVSVPAPASGLTYYGLDVTVLINGSNLPADTDTRVSIFVENSGIGFLGASMIVIEDNHTAHIGDIGEFGFAAFVVPVKKAFPIDITITNLAASTATDVGIQYVISGISYSDAYPIDSEEWTNGVDETVSLDNASSGQYVNIAPSFEDRVINISSLSGTAGNIIVESLNNTDWYQTDVRPYNALYGGNLASTAIDQVSRSAIVIPGTGRPHRFRVITAITGNVRLSYGGRV